MGVEDLYARWDADRWLGKAGELRLEGENGLQASLGGERAHM